MNNFFALHELVQGYLDEHGSLANAFFACKNTYVACMQTALDRFSKIRTGLF